MFGNKNIVSFELCSEKNTITVIFRESSGEMYASNPPRPVPDSIWKEIYGVEDGKIVFIEKIIGKHTPSSVSPESITFE